MKLLLLIVVCSFTIVAYAWPGLNVKPLAKQKSGLAPGESGTYYQLSDNERKELVWMAKAANAAYLNVDKPLGYRSFSRAEWDAVAVGCDELVYTEDGYFNVGSGLRGRLMVNMLNEGRVVLALSGTDFGSEISQSETEKDLKSAMEHLNPFKDPEKSEQYAQALQVMKGVLKIKFRSDLWIVGHSLGGSLTTYLALNIPSGRTNVKCATFNGLGVSKGLWAGPEKIQLVEKRLRNVYCEGDFVYKISARHFGPSYSLKVTGNWLKQHSLDVMIKEMVEKRTKWQGL